MAPFSGWYCLESLARISGIFPERASQIDIIGFYLRLYVRCTKTVAAHSDGCSLI